MPYGSVRLVPGVNVERTPTLLEAGYSVSNLIRYKDGLGQKLGGYQKYYSLPVSGRPRALHAWQDLNVVGHLASATTSQLAAITSGTLTDLTPQTKTTNFAPKFTTTINTPTVTVDDSNIANVTTYDAIYFNTPVSVGGIILSGLYPIVQIGGTTTYNITAATNATSSVANGGAVPTFTTSSGSTAVTVTLTAHGRAIGDSVVFPITTTGSGVTILGSYTVNTVPTANTFTITASTVATGATTFSMNSGNAQLLYYITLGPLSSGTGFGVGGFGVGGFGSGSSSSGQTGTPITATDWTLDNWGELLLACPEGGGIYYWDPNGGFTTANFLGTAPPFNTGIFVSMATQILVAFGSTSSKSIGVQQDPLLVKWSDSGNFTNWTISSQTQARERHLPTGSKIVGGLAAQLQNFLWTDIDLWSMSYIGPPNVFGFNKIGANCGLVGPQALTTFRGSAYWMSQSNFFVLSGNGVQALPCPVWDVIFQDLDTANIAKCRAISDTPFNEIFFCYPSSSGGTGECDKYVKVNVTEPGTPWDYGTLARSAGIDQSVLGNPIMASPSGIIYQHETTNDADGAPLNSSFTTGYFFIAEGEEFSFVDQILPDFKWGTFAGAQTAQIQLTIDALDFPGDTPTTFGPYSVIQTTQFVSVRIRARQMRFTVSSSDVGSFWRLGRVRYRYAPDGRR